MRSLPRAIAESGRPNSWLFHSSSLASAFPAAVSVGMFGSMSLVVPQTTVQRVIPNAALGRVTAVFLTGEAAATLLGAIVGPTVAQEAHLPAVAAAATLAVLAGALLAYLLVPRTPAIVPGHPLTASNPS